MERVVKDMEAPALECHPSFVSRPFLSQSLVASVVASLDSMYQAGGTETCAEGNCFVV